MDMENKVVTRTNPSGLAGAAWCIAGLAIGVTAAVAIARTVEYRKFGGKTPEKLIDSSEKIVHLLEDQMREMTA